MVYFFKVNQAAHKVIRLGVRDVYLKDSCYIIKTNSLTHVATINSLTVCICVPVRVCIFVCGSVFDYK